MIKSKQYEFGGVDFKTELLLGLMTGLVFILIWAGLVYTYYSYNNLDSVVRVPKRIFFGSMFLGLLISLFSLKWVTKYLKLQWKINMLKDYMSIIFKNYEYKILYNEITTMTLNGNNGIRYLTLKYNNEIIKMRIGTNRLMPFSKKEDIETLDIFWNELESFLPNKYVNKKLNLSLIPEGTISVIYKK